MSTELHENPLDLKRILEQANNRLSPEQRIRPDDPAYSLVVLNEELLKAHTSSLEQSVKNATLEINTLLEQERKTVQKLHRQLLRETLEESGEEVRKKAAIGLGDWETGFVKRMDITLNGIQAAVYALIILCVTGSLWFAINLGNWLGDQFATHNSHPQSVNTPSRNQHKLHR